MRASDHRSIGIARVVMTAMATIIGRF